MIDHKHVRVEAGDTLYKIANKHNTTVHSLVRKNHIRDKHMIHVGDKLVVIPKKGKMKKQSVEETTTNQNTANATQQATTNSSNSNTNYSTGNSAQEWIASRESGGSYTATNGRYVGKYQLDSSYLNGDYSPANQEKVAAQYAQNRYGSWEAAQAFWQSHGWW